MLFPHPSRTSVLVSLLISFAVAPASAQSARVEIGPKSAGITASTYSSGSFVIRNTSATHSIDEVRLDLSTALFEDLVFDPNGAGGDLVSKGFTPDSGGAAAGVGGATFHAPEGGGFDELRIPFTDFDPGEVFTFSVDVDPNTIQGVGAPGPNDSGSVSGLELSGATVTVTYAGGAVQTSEAYRVPSSQSESACELRSTLAPAPGVTVLGAVTPSQVFTDAWTVRVTGTPGRTVSLLVVEGGLYTAGVPGGGFDIDPFEANTALGVAEHSAVLDGSGVADIAITLNQSASEGGITSLLAVEEDAGGVRGRTSGVQVLHYLDVPISFQKTTLSGASLSLPTTLQFGPDGLLYVGQQNGVIQAFTVAQVGGSYSVTASETITLIQDIPNHDDDGTVNAGITTRQVTGILVAGTAGAPEVYVSSSDPRIGAGGSGTDLDLDTNSGVISKLTKSGGVWSRQDLVRGLPRSEENHGPNGMQLDPVSNTLYLAQGGHTNMGAVSNNFAMTPEYALSAAILSIDLDAIGAGTYDLPTLDDEDRAGATDAGDPFGGNDAKNQAMLVAGGPVQVHSPGWRNPYDVVLTEGGRMYAVDNGPNAGWGDEPVPDGGGSCANGVSEPGHTHPDGLHHITGPGYYAGHPNPTRANQANTFNPSNPQSPVASANPVECEYREPNVDDGAITAWTSSTNGICEYTSTEFGGAMLGDLLTISLNGKLRRIKPDAGGSSAVLIEDLFGSVGSGSLDVTAQGDADPFPGTIWVVNRTGNDVAVFTPNAGLSCSGAYDPVLDEDFDGFTNADELDNGTDPCSAGDVPPDHDGDFVSDRNDPDDDGDGIPDHKDRFAIDASDGFDLAPPFILDWETTTADVGGILGLGFTGMMKNDVDAWLDLFDPDALTAGGAAGVLTIESAGSGTADGGSNDLTDGFQIGFRPAPGADYTVRARVVAPFLGLTPTADQKVGLAFGTGGQDDFLSLRLSGAGVELHREVGGVVDTPVVAALALPGPSFVDVWLDVDPNALTVTPWFHADGGVPTAMAPVALPPAWTGFGQTLAAGLFVSSGASPAFAATFDHLEVDGALAPTRINAGGPAIGDWVPDDAFVAGGSKYTSSNPVTLSSDVPPLVPADMFRSERYKNGDVTWSVPLPSGKDYDVRLYFAEVYYDQTGKRVFDVEIEGAQVLDDYDIVADVGPDIGTMKRFTVSLTDGTLDVTLKKVTQNPKLSGLEIVELPDGVPGLVEPYGLGIGGANLGLLDSTTPPTTGGSMTLDLTMMGAAPIAILAFSQGETSLPLLGGTLLIALPPITDPAVLPVTLGDASIAFPIPGSPAHVGLTFRAQAAATDAGQPAGWRFTNGLRLTIGSQ